MGRIAPGPDAVVRMGYPGIPVRFRYRGPAPILFFDAFSDHCFFNISCNHGQPAMLRLTEGTNAIALPFDSAPDTGWLVDLVRRNESWQGVVTFIGLGLPPDCELLIPPNWSQRRLLFIGDSITSGEYVECLPPGDSRSLTPATTNAARSYGMLLGRELDAQVHLVSYGGRGIVRTWDGKQDANNAPEFFPLALPDEPAAKWDHTRYPPDVIVVCLGQNDFSSGLIDEAVYTAAYTSFVWQIRAVHPRAGLLFASSPMHSEIPGTLDQAKRDRLVRCLENVARALRASTGVNVAVIALSHQPGTMLNSHPTALQHEQIAREILPALRALTGW